MATKDGFQPDSSPIFLSEPAEEIGQPEIGKALGRAATSSRILKASIWAVAATAIGIAVLSVADPIALVADVTASWVEKSAPQPDADPSAPAIPSVAQSTAATQDVSPTTNDAPPREEVAAAPEPAPQRQPEIDRPPSEAMFKQFQAWAAEEDARAQAEPARPAQGRQVQAAPDAPVRTAQDASAQVQPAKKQRRARSVHNARAEIRSQRQSRARAREEQNAPAPVAPVPDPRAQEQAVQNSQMPSFLQGFGLR